MTKLFLHIGTWKTGSSTIQYNLYRLRNNLEKEGYFYLCKENKMVINDGIIRNFTSIENDYVKKSREKFKEILDRKRSTNSGIDFISSAEEFSGNPFQGFKNAKAVAKNLFEITKGFDLDIYIIVYLRRQDDFFESLYQQSVRLGGESTFDNFREKFDSSDFNWHLLLKSYEKLFGKEKIIVRRYNRKYLPNKNSLIQDFGKTIGSDVVSNYQSTISRNKGFSRDTLEITRIVNKYFDDDERYQLRKIYDKVNAKSPFQGYSYFSPAERAEFLDMYKESNSLVLKEFLNSNEETLFPPPQYEKNHSIFEGLTIETLVVNFSKALLLVKKKTEKENRKLSNSLKNKFFRYRIRKKIIKKLNRYPNFKKLIKKILGK